MTPNQANLQETVQLKARVSALEALLIVQDRVVQERTERLEEANIQLERLATTDGLTGLKNHRAFQEQLSEEFERSQRYRFPISLILLDVDRFKPFNDTFGHPRGDQVLYRIGSVIRSATRKTDIVARYGGEEFGIVLLGADEERAMEAAERLRFAIESTPWVERSITASLGVATVSPDIADASTLIARAETALCHSKQAGRNCVTHCCELAPHQEPLVLRHTDLIQTILEDHQESLSSASEYIRQALTQAYDAAIAGWSRALDFRDHETEGHSQRVTEMTLRLARRVGMNEEEMLYARWGALLHDIGKMGVPDNILLKPGKLNEEEWEIMRKHPRVAYDMLSPIAFLRPALDIPYCHHEKWDGTGYPRGLAGEEIPHSARLFAVIDVWDALSSDRPYRPAWPWQKVRSHLRSLAGTHFDPRAVRAFLELLEQMDAQQNASTLLAA